MLIQIMMVFLDQVMTKLIVIFVCILLTMMILATLKLKNRQFFTSQQSGCLTKLLAKTEKAESSSSLL